MFPIRDNIVARRTPVVTVALILANLAVFGMCAIMSERELEAFFFRYGLIPAKIFRPDIVSAYYWRKFGALVPSHYSLADSLMPVLSCMFLHGGVVHVVGNMWMLWIFGDNVEDCLGHFGFLIFYVACGVASSLFHILSAPLSPVVTIGASGAVAGVMGAYMILYPRARVLMLVWILFIVDFWSVPAFLFLFYWFLIQVFSGVATLGSGMLSGGVAWWAHVGGFLAGFGFVLVSGVRPPQKPSRTYERARYYFDPRTGRYTKHPFG